MMAYHTIISVLQFRPRCKASSSPLNVVHWLMGIQAICLMETADLMRMLLIRGQNKTLLENIYFLIISIEV